MKRSLGPRVWLPSSQLEPEKKRPHGLIPLVEGPVIGQPAAPSSSPGNIQREPPMVKPYGRGAINEALRELAIRPEQCVEYIQDRRKSETSKGPFQSRKNTWQTLAQQAGYQDGFSLTPTMIFAIMGAMDKAGYRSPELYLDTA